ncbi:hypothetical protein HanPSC8_Chr06g0251231 [Helianthus annuus]|nr:hypothetical protein HanPSC8_Chr06g0251231 [Helianthus annuus]
MLALLVVDPVDLRKTVLFGLKKDLRVMTWLVEKVEVQQMVLVEHQQRETEDHLAYRPVQTSEVHYSYHRLHSVVPQAGLQKDQVRVADLAYHQLMTAKVQNPWAVKRTEEVDYHQEEHHQHRDVR